MDVEKASPGFSTNARKPSVAGQRAFSPSRDGRYERREAHQEIALGKTFCRCGKKLISGAATVMLGDGSAVISGVVTCGGVHMCVWCAAKILAVRAEGAQTAADALVKAGYGLALGTSTLRHFARQKYGSLRKGERGGLVAVLHDGWTGAYGSSGRAWRRLRDDFGIVGYERSFEDTWGEDSGWHLHWHTLWVFAEPLTVERCAEFQRRAGELWQNAVLKAGGYRVSDEYGTDVRLIAEGEEGDVARYLYKDGDKGTAGFGAEFARSDLKDARRGRMSPFQLGDMAAEEFVELGKAGPLVMTYREREHGVHGVKKHRRTPGLNKILRELVADLDERSDAEIAEDDGDGKVPLAMIPSATWYRHIVRVKGRRLALLRAAEALGVVGVRTLIESWGLVWGTDVLPPPELALETL